MATRTGSEVLSWNPYTSPGVVATPKAEATVGEVTLSNVSIDAGSFQRRIIKWSHRPAARLGGECQSFGERFWRNHWHIREVFNPLGGVLTDQEVFFYVHNAYRTAQNITAIGETGSDGITITDNGTPSFSVNGQTTLTYLADVDAEGPAVINYVATFTFTSGTLFVQITGQRLVVFPFEPQRGMIERWSWNTDIIPSGDGTEQRNSVRDIPAQRWIFEVLFGTEVQAARADNLVYGWRPLPMALPIHVDEVELTSAVTIGQGNLPVNFTADTHFGVGVDAVIFDDEFNFEQVSVTVVAPTLLTIDGSQPKANWPAGTKVMPLHSVNLSAPSAKLWPINASEYSFEMRNRFPVDVSDNSSFTLYQSKPVWESDWLIQGTYGRGFQKNVLRGGAGIGPFYDSSVEKFPKVQSTIIIDLPDRASWWNIKRFLHSLRGRQKTFWLPSHRHDFTVESDGSSVTINVEPAFYASQIFGNSLQVRRDIVVEFMDGTINYRTISDAVETAGVREVLTVPALSQTATIANVKKISYLYRVRLASDTVDLVHEFANDGEVALSIIEVGA